MKKNRKIWKVMNIKMKKMVVKIIEKIKATLLVKIIKQEAEKVKTDKEELQEIISNNKLIVINNINKNHILRKQINNK
jgi:hypothetical protein